MITQYQILNGDALKDQFPETIPGEIIVARECLVDGPVQGDTLTDFFNVRAKFISTFEDYSEQDYYQETKTEFIRMQEIPNDAEINLWFEDDLFCQVNLWFVIWLLHNSDHRNIYIVRPDVHTQYGFGGLNTKELIKSYYNRKPFTDLETVSQLWENYKSNNTDGLFSIATELKDSFGFLLPAVQAHIDRLPSDGNPGRPKRALLGIMQELETDEFGPVFREFCSREPIYGFGDLQVKRMLDELTNSH